MPTTSSTAFHPIGDIDAVDISRHALIEASAGTGKTYTIENLVVRLLKEDPDLNLENILLVTFTEKATSELKHRIRSKIESILAGDPELTATVRKRLIQALDTFDNAAITTIHGFCHTLLKAFPFETGNLFEQEVIDDGPLLEKLLREQMRSHWPRKFGHHLPALLSLADFAADGAGFIRTTVSLAQQLHGDPARETLIPDPARMDVDRLWHAARQTVLALKTLVGKPPRLTAEYNRLNINARTKTAIIRDMLEPIERTLKQVDIDDHGLLEFKSVVATLNRPHSSGGRNIDRLVPQKWLKAGKNLHVCPNLVAIKDKLEELIRWFVDLSHVLMLTSVDQLREDASAMKARNGWISYPDMLNRVADFVTGESAEEGLRQIRNRYRVAFVDEFQDTDDVQWKIFSALFLSRGDDAKANRLFLIGDPKQAIYGFRGADVFAYLSARQQMKTLSGKGLANLYALSVNWRSSPDLVACFNQIFSQNTWFHPREHKNSFDIGYTPSDSPEAGQLPVIAVSDRSRRPSFNVMDLTTATNHAAAKTLMAGFICREIRYLVEQAGIRMPAHDGRDRAFQFGDVAVLVRSQSEFTRMEPVFRESCIPYAYYRKPGLFQCREAHWLSIVLRAICNPEQTATVRLALLTPFFDVCPATLTSLQELPANHATMQLMARWHAYAQRRNWGRLFQSILEDSGLIFRHCVGPHWERTRTNLLQLLDHLEVSACAQNLDASGLVAMLDNLRLHDSDAGSDADTHQIEDEAGKVQILTMHMSKGLEFPVVFIAGGLTMHSSGNMHVYHTRDPKQPEQGYRKVIDLTASTGKEQAEKEIEDENKRLYYVALTRSRFKLYVPYFLDNSNVRWRGPICRFVSPSIAQAFLDAGDALLPNGWHEMNDPATIIRDRKCVDDETGAATIRLPDNHLLPEQTDFRHRQVSLKSFSSINQRLNPPRGFFGQSSPFVANEMLRRDIDEPAESMASETVTPNLSDELPGGTRMGSMFHHIFEHIDFQAVMDDPANILTHDNCRRVIESAMILSQIEPRWTPQISRLIAATLKMPIEISGSTLMLGQLSPAQRRHEVEFYFPLAESPSTGVQVPGCSVFGNSCGGLFIRGFIDLVFSWQDRFYFADWKSNYLEDGYHQSAMDREVASAGYELQYQLYAIAVIRWLKYKLGDRFDLHRHFGGAFYIFIRGVDSAGQDGIFFVTPEMLLPIESLQANIQKQIGGLQW